MDLSFIIVNFHNSNTLSDCLNSVYNTAQGMDFEVILVDNSPRDHHLEKVLEKFPNVRLIRNSANLGFARANNQGVRAATGDYFLFLNPDAVLGAGAAQRLLNHLRIDPTIGVIGPKVLDPGGTLQFSCRRFPTIWSGLFNRYSLLTRLFPENRFSKHYLMTDFDHNKVHQVDWVSGCCMMVPREAFSAVEGFDEQFFLFIEDVDLCKTINQLGYKVVYQPEAQVVHHITSSNGWMAPSTIVKRHRGMSYYYRKHFRINPLNRGILDSLITLRCLSQLFLNLFR